MVYDSPNAEDGDVVYDLPDVLIIVAAVDVRIVAVPIVAADDSDVHIVATVDLPIVAADDSLNIPGPRPHD